MGMHHLASLLEGIGRYRYSTKQEYIASWPEGLTWACCTKCGAAQKAARAGCNLGAAVSRPALTSVASNGTSERCCQDLLARTRPKALSMALSCLKGSTYIIRAPEPCDGLEQHSCPNKSLVVSIQVLKSDNGSSPAST